MGCVNSGRLKKRDVHEISIRCEGVLVVETKRLKLFVLAKDTISDRKHVKVRSHETSERIFWRADDGLSADVEAGVHQHWTTGSITKPAQEAIETRSDLFVHGLNSCRIINMRHGRDG